MNNLNEKINDIKDLLDLVKYCKTEESIMINLEHARNLIVDLCSSKFSLTENKK